MSRLLLSVLLVATALTACSGEVVLDISDVQVTRGSGEVTVEYTVTNDSDDPVVGYACTVEAVTDRDLGDLPNAFRSDPSTELVAGGSARVVSTLSLPDQTVQAVVDAEPACTAGA